MRMYIASADLMTRNTLRRVEVASPINDPAIRERILQGFELLLRDNRQARDMLPDGSYVRRMPTEGNVISAQEIFYQQAYDRQAERQAQRSESRNVPEPDPMES